MLSDDDLASPLSVLIINVAHFYKQLHFVEDYHLTLSLLLASDFSDNPHSLSHGGGGGGGNNIIHTLKVGNPLYKILKKYINLSTLVPFRL